MFLQLDFKNIVVLTFRYYKLRYIKLNCRDKYFLENILEIFLFSKMLEIEYSELLLSFENILHPHYFK